MSTDARITIYGDGPTTQNGGLVGALVGDQATRVTLVDVSVDSTDPVADVAFAAAKMARHAAFGPPEPQILNLPDSPAVVYVTGGDLTINGNLTSHPGTQDKPEEEETPPPTGDYHDEGTLFRFVNALADIGYSRDAAQGVLTHLLNRGILIRERGPQSASDEDLIEAHIEPWEPDPDLIDGLTSTEREADQNAADAREDMDNARAEGDDADKDRF